MKKQQCPEFPFFGANYPDARCIDGQLYDLDDCDDEGNPCAFESIPCPFCRTKEFIESQGIARYREIIRWIDKHEPEYDYGKAERVSNWLKYADTLGYDVITVTEDKRGFPVNLTEAVIGFEDFEDAKAFAKETNKSTLLLTKKDGWKHWLYHGHIYEPMKLNADWYRDDCLCFDKKKDWWDDEKERIRSIILNENDLNFSYEEFIEYMKKISKIAEAFDKLSDNEQVLLYDNEIPEIIPVETVRWGYDGETYIIAVK